jgi:hypothetical protein
MTTQKKTKIPQHTKWGIRVTTVIILFLTVLIVKNCVGSFMYGISTEQKLQNQFYELGYSHGKQKAQGMEKQPGPETDNLLLKKLYSKGFRDGWDSGQATKESQNFSETPQKDQ